jgi:hypothetical protein
LYMSLTVHMPRIIAYNKSAVARFQFVVLRILLSLFRQKDETSSGRDRSLILRQQH